MHHTKQYKTLTLIACLLFAINALADEVRIYEQDTAVNTQYHKPSATIENNGRFVETDAFGNKQFHKQQDQIKDGKSISQTLWAISSITNHIG